MITTKMSLQSAFAIWFLRRLYEKLEVNAGCDVVDVSIQSRDRVPPAAFFSPGKNGRFWSDGSFSFEDLEAIYVLGRHATGTSHQFTHLQTLDEAVEELRGKTNGVISPTDMARGYSWPTNIESIIKNFASNPQNQISVVGETLLDEVEAILIICIHSTPRSNSKAI